MSGPPPTLRSEALPWVPAGVNRIINQGQVKGGSRTIRVSTH